jgi:hypothetical protein
MALPHLKLVSKTMIREAYLIDVNECDAMQLIYTINHHSRLRLVTAVNASNNVESVAEALP